MKTRRMAALLAALGAFATLSGCIVVPGHEDRGREWRDPDRHDHRDGDRRDRRDRQEDSEHGSGMRSPNY